MATFISAAAPANFYPKPDELVIGKTGKREILGRVLPSKKRPDQPAVFSRYSFVGLMVVDVENGKIRAINNVRPTT